MGKKVQVVDMKSEVLKEKTMDEMAELQMQIAAMSEEELAEYRNSMDPDSMGFYEEEAPIYEDK